MHITNQKKFGFIFKIGHFFILMIFGIKRKMYNFDPCSVLLAIATDIDVLLMTGFVLQGHVSYVFCTSGIPDPQAYGANTRTRDTARKEKESAHSTYRK